MRLNNGHSNLTASEFRRRLLRWYDRHGRHDLPWQKNRTPYRVWVSEIMLQQTQVATVIPYFQRFMQRFPNLKQLATAPLDDVLHLWTGLGYYARGRNLHKAAQLIHSEHGGRFPRDLETVMSLPGIGRSTAAAILAQACEQPHAILDGNVKRVLSRFHAIEGWPGLPQIEAQLWGLAERYTPQQRIVDYTQAIMDLGATLCRRGTPNCPACPLQKGCVAYYQGRVAEFPHSKPKKQLPLRQTHMLLLEDAARHLLLVQRPPAGIWGGLWCLPECPENTHIEQWCRSQYGLDIAALSFLPTLQHSFSHFRLEIQPIRAQVTLSGDKVLESAPTVWYNPKTPQRLGLPAPVKTLIEQFRSLT
jgi:A/G-specific adenine glycosylase